MKLLSLFLVIAASTAQAYVPGPFCEENYGFGAYSAYTGDFQRPGVRDDYCFQLGFAEGKKMVENHKFDKMFCDSAFNNAKRNGLNAEVQMIESPSDCSNAGYSYGRGLLASMARAHKADIVTAACVAAYDGGYADGKTNLITHNYNSNIERACYQIGFADASAGI